MTVKIHDPQTVSAVVSTLRTISGQARRLGVHESTVSRAASAGTLASHDPADGPTMIADADADAWARSKRRGRPRKVAG